MNDEIVEQETYDVMDSILDSVKKLIGISKDYIAFDEDIIMAINTSFFTLWNLGIGFDVSKPFSITGSEEKWSDFIDDGKIEMTRSFVYLRTRLLFDPPTNSFLVDAINDQIHEYEFRMMVGSDEYELSEAGDG